MLKKNRWAWLSVIGTALCDPATAAWRPDTEITGQIAGTTPEFASHLSCGDGPRVGAADVPMHCTIKIVLDANGMIPNTSTRLMCGPSVIYADRDQTCSVVRVTQVTPKIFEVEIEGINQKRVYVKPTRNWSFSDGEIPTEIRNEFLKTGITPQTLRGTTTYTAYAKDHLYPGDPSYSGGQNRWNYIYTLGATHSMAITAPHAVTLPDGTMGQCVETPIELSIENNRDDAPGTLTYSLTNTTGGEVELTIKNKTNGSVPIEAGFNSRKTLVVRGCSKGPMTGGAGTLLLTVESP